MTNSYYFDYLIRTEKFPQSIYHQAKRKTVKEILEKFPAGSKILDAACGVGNITAPYCNKYKIIGIDEQSSAIDYCKKNYQGEYYVNDLFNLKFESNSFELILFLDSIEHLKNPQPALIELQRVLKVGGKILICTINYANPLWFVLENTWHRFFAGSCRTYSADVHPSRYTARLLEKHCQGLFKKIFLKKKVLGMELFYYGEKLL